MSQTGIFAVAHSADELNYTEDGEPHCASIVQYDYALVSSDARAARLKVAGKS